MKAALKPITLYTHKAGPNGWKAAILFKELNVPYQSNFLEFGNGVNGVKHPDFLKINPNGRIPAIIDHNNNDLIVWESGAILQYVQKKYDTQNKVGPQSEKDEAEILTWLGLGPSQGQANWFLNYHKEQVPSAIDRYLNETKRCYGVLDGRLKDQTSGYIVGNRLSIADIAFYPWIRISDGCGIKMEKTVKSDFPNIYKWYHNMRERQSVQDAYAEIKIVK